MGLDKITFILFGDEVVNSCSSHTRSRTAIKLHMYNVEEDLILIIVIWPLL